MFVFNNCSYMCHCAQLSYTTQHKTELIIFSLILQTIIVAQAMSSGGERVCQDDRVRLTGSPASLV